MSRTKFERGNALFNCSRCKRRTRNSTDVHHHNLCGLCDEASMIENGISDGAYPTPEALARAEAEIRRLNAQVLRKGGAL